ncbi:ATP-dependent Clp protease proteolytic subunit [Planotetraspora phitsanulokensis]|uniref:ATP-dependent Clp protease proteolytic subunit n=1 Tax=Planotetraspora phitsanulokensis TaxID=575192 RepID=A0A8J3XL94_9ACTN|nr:ATP-dependent Clp protease proteolytic subunit 2 [Planotetraspora phitsanulokensis]
MTCLRRALRSQAKPIDYDASEGDAVTSPPTFFPHATSGFEARGREDGSFRLEDQLYQRLLRERIVVLGTQVSDEVANRLCAELLLLAADDPNRDIWLYINSPGGSVTSGMAIYDMMEYVPNDVCTVAMGLAASMGQFLLCAGAPGKRYALPNARIMMHQPSGGIGGTAADIAIQAEQMLYVKKTLAERIAFHTGQPLDQIERDSDRDRWFTAEEAKDYGFIDHVVRSARQVPSEGAVS